MKKLMIAAAAAAMIGGAYAALPGSCTDPTVKPDDPTNPCFTQTLVYQWQFKGKTGTGAIIRESETTKIPGTQGGTCVDGETPSELVSTTCEVIRVPGSLSIVAYTYLCKAECWAFEPGKGMLTNPEKEQWYATKPLKSLVAPYRKAKADIEANGGSYFIKQIDVAHVIGKSASQYELAGKVEFDFPINDIGQKYALTFAGFGSYDKKNLRVTSVSGNFAGTQTPPRYPKVGCDGLRCPPATYWECCPLQFSVFTEKPSVAYGTWSVKYNSSATKKFDTNYTNYWVK